MNKKDSFLYEYIRNLLYNTFMYDSTHDKIDAVTEHLYNIFPLKEFYFELDVEYNESFPIVLVDDKEEYKDLVKKGANREQLFYVPYLKTASKNDLLNEETKFVYTRLEGDSNLNSGAFLTLTRYYVLDEGDIISVSEKFPPEWQEEIDNKKNEESKKEKVNKIEETKKRIAEVLES
jgi:hypothetical protein